MLEDKDLLMKMKLQFFAEEPDVDTPDDDVEVDDDVQDAEDETKDQPKKKERLFSRSELAAIAKKQAQEAVDAALAEERKRSKMTESERLAAERKEAEDALQAKTQAIAEREMRLDVLELLAENNLPQTFLSFVNLSDDIETNTEKIDQLKTLFDEELSKAANAKLSNIAGKQTKSKIASSPSKQVDAFKAVMADYK